MKTTLLFLSFFMLTAVVSRAQEIAVQSPSNVTKVYNDLNKAITAAEAGSIVFLPAGGVQLNDTVKIMKRLTIIGVGHRSDTEGGFTMVAGKFQFYKGSDGSSLMGVYLSGDVYIANTDGEVNNFLLQYCNVNSVQVGNQYCSTLLINQNYLRNGSNGGNSPIHFTLENIGNTNVSLTLSMGKTAAQLIGGTSPAYQFKFGNKEASSCVNATPTGVWTATSTSNINLCSNFLMSDASDTINIGVKLTIPSDSLTGTQTDTFTATATGI